MKVQNFSTGMLPKEFRNTRKQVEELFKIGKTLSILGISFKFTPIRGKNPTISVVVSKSTLKSAVKRNSLRRKVYRILKKHWGAYPKVQGVLILKDPKATPDMIEDGILKIFSKIK